MLRFFGLVISREIGFDVIQSYASLKPGILQVARSFRDYLPTYQIPIIGNGYSVSNNPQPRNDN
jgi:hypothetical protein